MNKNKRPQKNVKIPQKKKYGKSHQQKANHQPKMATSSMQETPQNWQITMKTQLKKQKKNITQPYATDKLHSLILK